MTKPQRTRRDLSRFRLALRDHSERVNFYADWYKVLRSELSDAEFAGIAEQVTAGKPISQITPFKALIPQIARCKEVDSKV